MGAEAPASAAFRVTQGGIQRRRIVLLETNDGVEAEAFVHGLRRKMTNRTWDYSLRIEGTHPTHDYGPDGWCRNEGCLSVNNGSYGSHFPCGFEFEKPLIDYIEDWKSTQKERVGRTLRVLRTLLP